MASDFTLNIFKHFKGSFLFQSKNNLTKTRRRILKDLTEYSLEGAGGNKPRVKLPEGTLNLKKNINSTTCIRFVQLLNPLSFHLAMHNSFFHSSLCASGKTRLFFFLSSLQVLVVCLFVEFSLNFTSASCLWNKSESSILRYLEI